MASYTITKDINANPQRTFEVFADFEHVQQHVSGITKLEVLTDGPIGKGTRFRETRLMFNREATEEMEITDFQPGKSYTVGCESCGAQWSSTFSFQPVGDGTQVRLEMICLPVSLVAKLVSPLSGLFSGAMKKCMEQDLDELKKIAESAQGEA